MKKALALIIAAVMMLTVLPMASFAEDAAIEKVEVGVIEPVAGDDLLNDYACYTENVKITAVKWFDIAAGSFADEIVFEEDCEYVTYVYVSADEGYTFTKETVVEINGYEVKANVAADGKTLTASLTQYCFAEAEPVEISEITIDFISPILGEPAFTDFLLETEGVYVADAAWFEVNSDKFIDDETNFSAGKYYIQVTFDVEGENYFSKDVKVIINGESSLDVSVNPDGTITAVAAFEIEEEPVEQSFFARIFSAIRTVFLTIVRFFGEMIGLN